MLNDVEQAEEENQLDSSKTVTLCLLLKPCYCRKFLDGRNLIGLFLFMPQEDCFSLARIKKLFLGPPTTIIVCPCLHWVPGRGIFLQCICEF